MSFCEPKRVAVLGDLEEVVPFCVATGTQASINPIMNVASLPWFLYLQWAYAIWQFIRENAIIRLLFKLPIWLVFYRWRKKRVFLLNDTYEDLRQDHDVSSFRVDDVKNGIKIIAREGYWVKARFYDDEYIIVHQNHLAKIWLTDFNDDFVINKVDITDNLSIARKVSTREAILKIASTFKTTEIKTTCIYSHEQDISLNTNLAGFIATFPLFAQAKGLVTQSAWMSLAILIMDICMIPFYKLYDGAFEYVSLMIKLHIFKKRTWLYLLFSLFSERWSYGDKAKKCVYNGKDRGFLVHTLALFKNIDDYELTFGYGDYQSWYPAPEDQHFVINKNRIYALPILPRMGGYCKVMCRIDAIVTGKASACASLYAQPPF